MQTMQINVLLTKPVLLAPGTWLVSMYLISNKDELNMVIREPEFVFGGGGVVFVTGVGWELEAGGGDSVVVTATQPRHNAVTEEVSGGFEQVKR